VNILIYFYFFPLYLPQEKASPWRSPCSPTPPKSLPITEPSKWPWTDPGSREVSDVFDLASLSSAGGTRGAELAVVEGCRMPAGRR